MIVLQYWFDFCHTSTLINHRCPPYLESFSCLLLIPTPLGYYRAPIWIPLVIQQIPIGYLFTCVSVYTSMLSPFISPSPSSPQPLPISLFSMSASPLLLCDRIRQTTLLDSLSSVQSLSRVRLFVTPWIAAHQASLSITNSQSLLKLKLICPSS